MDTDRWLRRALAALALIGLAGCDDVSIVQDQDTGLFSPEEYARDAAQGPLPVAVLGSAFDASGERLTRLILGHMKGADWSPHAAFVAAGEPTGSRMYSYVMMFNGPVDVNAAALCAGAAHVPPVPAAASDAKSIRVVAGLCRNGAIATGVTGRASRVDGFDDARFNKLIVGVMQALTRPNASRIGR
jgi:hypothetical protein